MRTKYSNHVIVQNNLTLNESEKASSLEDSPFVKTSEGDKNDKPKPDESSLKWKRRSVKELRSESDDDTDQGNIFRLIR